MRCMMDKSVRFANLPFTLRANSKQGGLAVYQYYSVQQQVVFVSATLGIGM